MITYDIVQVNVALELPEYIFSENDAGAEVCLLVMSGTVQPGQSFRAGYGSFSGTASESWIELQCLATMNHGNLKL